MFLVALFVCILIRMPCGFCLLSGFSCYLLVVKYLVVYVFLLVVGCGVRLCNHT